MTEAWWSSTICTGLRVYYVDRDQTVCHAQVVAYDDEAKTLNLVVFVDRSPGTEYRARVPYAAPQNGILIPETWHI